jgi:hypothetical protein
MVAWAMAKNPIWRSTFATLAGAVDTQVHRVLGSEAAGVAVGLAHTVQRDIAKRAEHASARVWHMFNLPTGSDVNRLFVQLGSVEREIRGLQKRVGDVVDGLEGEDGAGSEREVIARAKAHRSNGGARPHSS